MSNQDENVDLVESSGAAEVQECDKTTDIEVMPQHLEASESSKRQSKTTKRETGTAKKTINRRKAANISSDPPGRISSKKGSRTANKGGNYRALKVTCPPPGSDSTRRVQGHDELMRLESRRRLEIAQQMEMYQDRWHVAKDILDFASESVGSAERLINGFIKASEAFASNLRAISEDKYIDTKGEVADTWKAQNRLTKQRDFSDTIDILSPISSAILESQSAMAKQAKAMENVCNQISSNVLAELQELTSTVQGGARTLKIHGGAILAEMKQADNDVTTIWDIFDGLVSNDLIEQSTHGGSMHGASVHGTKVFNDFMDMIDKSTHGASMHGGVAVSSIRGGSMHGGEILRRGNQGKKAMLKRMGGGKDCWLVAQFYKVAVQHQVLAMAATREKMDNLVDKIIALEEKRVSGLHTLLATGFLQRKKALFATFPKFNEIALKDLEGADISEESLDAFFDNRSLERLKHSKSHRSSIMNRRSVLTGFTGPLEIENTIEEFGDPFDDLSQILSSKVVELKKPGALYMMDAEWTMALVIVSKFGIFHVIQAPIGKSITEETSSVQAFQSLRPDMDFGSPNAWKARSELRLLETLTPVVSLDVTQCIFQNSTLQRREVQVLVTGEQTTRNKLFGTSGTVKCTLRLKSPMVAKAFTEALKSMKKSILSPNKAKAEPTKK
ncbi:unnamed protein product [Cylindrotheca closterium]|uniref:Uncharacterized protein n=1 Tax=Cylindrotheca closterium TaxID=2856 RepID=A0AAD2FMZ6_9STRA|nr:unnamed protein product [Cylindrotheca closterium]